MNTNVLIGILFGVAAALVADWWTQVARDVQQMGQEIRDEERWP